MYEQPPEVQEEYERDGWHVSIAFAPDWDYAPGEDDEVYVSPRTFQDLSRGGSPSDARTCEACEGEGVVPCRRCKGAGWLKSAGMEQPTCLQCEGSGFSSVDCPQCEGSGEVPDPDGFTVDYRDGTFYVPGDEVRRVIGIGWGPAALEHDDTRKEAREAIESDARAIAREDLSWIGVVVTATREGAEGSASLWGIDFDARKYAKSMEYALEVGRDELALEAIGSAARSVLGGLAPLALSY